MLDSPPLTRTRRITVMVFAALLASSGIASCGDNGDATGSGDTVKVMVISNSEAGPQLAEAFPQIVAGARAAAMEINARGGIDGRDIEIEACETRGDPNTAVQCAQEAVTDRLPAVVGAFDLVGNHFSVLDAAGVPSIAPWVAGDKSLMLDTSYPITGGGFANTAGQMASLSSRGATSVGAVYSSVSAAPAMQVLKPIEAAYPDLEIQQVVVPANTVDYSAVVAAAMRKDGISLSAYPNDIVGFLRALRQAGGEDAKISTSVAALLPAAVKDLGADAEGLIAVSGFYPPSSTDIPAVAKFVEFMDKVDPEASKDEFAQNAYAGVQIFAEAAAGLDEITAETIREALDTTDAFDPGLQPQISFQEPNSPLKNLTRYFNPNVIFNVVKDGVYVRDSEFVNAYTGEPVTE